MFLPLGIRSSSYPSCFDGVKRLSKHDLGDHIRRHADPPLPDVHYSARRRGLLLHPRDGIKDLLTYHILPVLAQRHGREAPTQQLPSLRVVLGVGHLEQTVRRLPGLGGPKVVVIVSLEKVAADPVYGLERINVRDEDGPRPDADVRAVPLVQRVVVLHLVVGDSGESTREFGELGVPWSWDGVQGVGENLVTFSRELICGRYWLLTEYTLNKR